MKKKLRLNKKTIAELSGSQQVVGGKNIDPTDFPTLDPIIRTCGACAHTGGLICETLDNCRISIEVICTP